MPDKDIQAQLAALLQGQFPIKPRPFAEIAKTLASSEDEVISMTRRLFDEGKARRFGAVFDSEALGYRGTLCGAGIDPAELERCAALVSEHNGVTHCYEREHKLNLWFTLTARKEHLDDELSAMGKKIAPFRIYSLPAVKRFKIQVTFGSAAPGTGPQTGKRPPSGGAAEYQLRPGDEEIVRLMQGNIPVLEEPFAWAAGQLGISPESLISSLERLKEAGALRRVCVIMRHREIGFTANGMCTWNVPAGDVARAGALLAERPEVTHCYERIVYPVFPYNLFAMVHAGSREAALEIFRKISEHAGLSGGQVLFSVREFKKASMSYFT